MKYMEIEGDLFTVESDCLLAHCVSSDFALGAGIAKTFRDRYGVKDMLIATGNRNKWDGNGYCIITDSFENGKPMRKIANLITKERAFHKPTYSSLRQALEDMKHQCIALDIRLIAMPLIGCGLDGLSWNRVSEMIKDIFADYDCEIRIYRFK